jgi:hypothetical protein
VVTLATANHRRRRRQLASFQMQLKPLAVVTSPVLPRQLSECLGRTSRTHPMERTPMETDMKLFRRTSSSLIHPDLQRKLARTEAG